MFIFTAVANFFRHMEKRADEREQGRREACLRDATSIFDLEKRMRDLDRGAFPL